MKFLILLSTIITFIAQLLHDSNATPIKIMSNIDENRFNDENSKNKIGEIMKKYDNMLSQNDIKMIINAQNSSNANEEGRKVRLIF